MLVRRLSALCGLLLCWFVAAQAELPGQFSDELDIDRYDCAVTLQPSPTLSDTSAVRILLEATAPGDAILVSLKKRRISIETLKGAVATPLASAVAGVLPGHPYHLTIMRCGGSLGLIHDDTVLCRVTMPHAPGKLAAVTAQTGWQIVSSSIERKEPVLFADDFVRTSDDTLKDWKSVSGDWMLQSVWDSYVFSKNYKFNFKDSAQNPFSWIGIGAPALCTVGDAGWEDYTFRVGIQPSEGTAAGIMFNMTDAKHGLLLRWTSAHDHSAHGNRLTLSRVSAGGEQELQASTGGFVAGQWYQLTAESNLDGVRVLVDGRERLALKNLSPWRGGVGLYTAGARGTVFDNVTVYGHAINTDLLEEAKQTHIADKFVKDENGMQEWASTADAWLPDPNSFLWHWYNEDLYGTHAWLSLTLQRLQGDGSMTLVLNGDGKSHTSGYRAVVQFSADPAKSTYTLYDGEQKLAEKSGDALDPFTDYDLRFWHTGSQLQLEVDDTVVVSAPCHSVPSTWRPGYYLSGAITLRKITAITTNRYNYTFSEAPTGWRAVGNWAPSIRWPCQPEWSFLSGWSRGEAVLWHKQRFTGDQALSYFAGVKMEYPRDHLTYHQRFPGLFAATICGDGQNPRSGYCGIYGAADDTGTPYRRAQLLRNGVVVLSLPIYPSTDWNDNHHNWFDVRLDKHGNHVTFTVTINHQTTTVPFTDPQPLDAGRMAIWTCDNGISLARACLDFAQAPVTPPSDPQVLLDTPWYPEWQNLHQPATLQFPDSWATSGKPVSLHVTPRTVPAGDEGAAVVQGHQLVVNPAKVGEHWYEVSAGDGQTRSAGFHYSLPVFDPALKRDDSHAVVLYRFKEGSGTVVHDVSKLAPAIDLHLPAKTGAARWVPGQGLALDGTDTLNSAGVTDKLLHLAKSRAGTLEFWMSLDTLYASADTHFDTCYAYWGNPGGQPNWSIGSYYTFFAIDTHNYIHRDFMFDQHIDGARISLHHVVFTWESNGWGSTTTAYVDGVNQGNMNIPWGEDAWNADNAVFMLGNNGQRVQPFIGTYYLVALHDRCFTQAEIRRHYQAGPSAE